MIRIFQLIRDWGGIIVRWWLNVRIAAAKREEQIAAAKARDEVIITAKPPASVKATTQHNAKGKVGQSKSPLL